jgi:uncharacterized protein (DUF2141 family)
MVSQAAQITADPLPPPSADAGKAAKPASLPAAAGTPAGQARSTITVRIEGLRHDRGTIYVALYDNKRAFDEKKGQLVGAQVRSRNRGALAVFDNVVPGKYAVAFFHDENGNGKLDTNLLGIPTEGFGFSKDAMGKLGPPTFAAAALSIPAGPVSVVMHAKYFETLRNTSAGPTSTGTNNSADAKGRTSPGAGATTVRPMTR